MLSVVVEATILPVKESGRREGWSSEILVRKERKSVSIHGFWGFWVTTMKVTNRGLRMFEVGNRFPSAFFSWVVFPLNEIFKFSVANARVDDIFDYIFFMVTEDGRRRRRTFL
jgi:hypothetical protein